MSNETELDYNKSYFDYTNIEVFYLTEQEIIIKWKSGLSKNQIAKIYKREYNQQIKIIRSEIKHRHSGKFINNYEALEYVEKVIYKYLRINF